MSDALTRLRSAIPKRPEVPPLEHYTYGITVNKRLRYIGKGSGFRAWNHGTLLVKLLKATIRGETPPKYLYFHKMVIRQLQRSKFSMKVVIFEDGLSEDEAYRAEERLIASHELSIETGNQYGLWNNGGRGSNIGYRIGSAEDAYASGGARRKSGKRGRPVKAKRKELQEYFGYGCGNGSHGNEPAFASRRNGKKGRQRVDRRIH